ncbi:MAG TPA: NADH dehydrogenase [Firmicutes bacterium]|nr:NADH dehydrogenase [Bacillota bacterium]
MLFLVLPAIPLVGALALLGLGRRGRSLPLLASFLVLLVMGWGAEKYLRGTQLVYTLPWVGPFVPRFQMDAVSALFLLFAAFLWWVVSLYAPEYMAHEGGPERFQFCSLLTFFAVIGVFLAGDLLTLLLFFELMTITSFFWVIHRWNLEAIRAGYLYLFFSIAGGLFILLGIVLLLGATGSVPILGAGRIAVESSWVSWGVALLVAGFGIKAGMVPLHLWLPHAHGVAPTPASALLSGLLIKVGAYGLLRIGALAGWGLGGESVIPWLGPALTFLGGWTMLLGVGAALLQSDAKRLLAYHSVSQMGYIILGLGIGLFLGPAGGIGFLGSLYHIVNHGLFKAALFLGVGVVYLQTGTTDLNQLGGLWRRLPVTAVLMLLAVLGITGAPGFNGYASKTLLHHAVSLAADTGPAWLVWVERLFLLVGVGTATSFAKLYYLMFLGKPKQQWEPKVMTRSTVVALGVLGLVILGFGLRPTFFLETWAQPAAEKLGLVFNENLSFWNPADLVGMVVTLGLGVALCWAGLRSKAFRWQPPRWLSLMGVGSLLWEGLRVLVRVGSWGYLQGKRWFAHRRRRLLASPRLQGASITVGGLTIKGISLDILLLVVVLAVLIIGCLHLPALRVPSSATGLDLLGW